MILQLCGKAQGSKMHGELTLYQNYLSLRIQLIIYNVKTV